MFVGQSNYTNDGAILLCKILSFFIVKIEFDLVKRNIIKHKFDLYEITYVYWIYNIFYFTSCKQIVQLYTKQIYLC